MKVIGYFLLFFVLALIIVFLGIVLGDAGPWYFAWLIGTGLLILTAAAAGLLYDAQATHSQERKE